MKGDEVQKEARKRKINCPVCGRVQMMLVNWEQRYNHLCGKCGKVVTGYSYKKPDKETAKFSPGKGVI